MALDMTTADALLKEAYQPDAMKNLTYKDNPFYAMVPKDENFVGDTRVVPLTIGNPQGRSSVFATALAAKGESLVKKFNITHKRDYSLVTIDNLTILATAGKEGAFVEAASYEINNGINALVHSISSALFRNGGGSIGRVGSSAATSITLKEVNDVVNFEVDMVIEVASTDGTSGSLRTGTVTISDIDRDTGVLTTDATSTIGSLADDDYIFCDGDFGVKLSGLAAWVPDSAPSSTSFYGLDRTTDVTRLGGVRIASTDVTGLPLEEKILHACARLGREGARPDTCFVSYEKFRDLEISLSSKVQYTDVEKAGVGFSAISIRGPKGTVKVIPDQSCPNNRAYVLTMDSWKLCTAGPAVQTLDRDGKMLREAAADAYEVRIAFYGNLACFAPGWNAVIDLS